VASSYLRGPVKSNSSDSYTSGMETISPDRATWDETWAWLGWSPTYMGTEGRVTGLPLMPPMRTSMEAFWRMTKSRRKPSGLSMYRVPASELVMRLASDRIISNISDWSPSPDRYMPISA